MSWEEMNEAVLRGIRNPGLPEKPALVVPLKCKGPARIGEAFDYALRFGLSARFKTRSRELGAEIGILERVGARDRPDRGIGRRVHTRAWRRFDLARDQLDAADLRTGLADEAAKACLELVTLQGIQFARSLKTYLDRGSPTADQVHELQSLYDIVPWAEFEPDPEAFIVLNPSFREPQMSSKVAADLLVGDTLIDIKVVSNPSLTTGQVVQLVKYAALARKNGTTWRPRPVPVEHLGIYYARCGHLHRFDLCDCLESGQEELVLEGILYFSGRELGLG